MASMASRPPDRKWTSSRKVPGRAGGIGRRETLKPPAHTGRKPKSLPLGEAELQSGHAGPQSGHAGPLGRIQRSLEKMTSSELWVQQQRTLKRTEARKPQPAHPQVATPHAAANNDQEEAATSEPTSGRGTQQVRPLRNMSWVSTDVEELKELAMAPRPQPPPLEHHPVFSSSSEMTAAASELTFGRRRSHHNPSAHKGQARQSSSEDGSSDHDRQQHDAAVWSSPGTALRYPPNSSRSANYTQQPRTSGGGGCLAVPVQPSPSPTFGPSDS